MTGFNESIFDQFETENIDKLDSPMKEFYRGKTVFLTGGTGFVGLLILEKLLRCEVRKVFLFVRPKKGKTPTERVHAIFQEPVYVRLQKNRDHFMSKIVIVEGDLGHKGLGIKAEDVNEFTRETELLIHAAADVRFDETLKEAVETNVKGTLELLKLAEKMPKLLTFMYMSTAYANCPQKEIKEKFYDTPMDPLAMIRLAESISEKDEDMLNILTERIVMPWPNTYAYTKALAEELMRIYCQKLPIVVVRPSIIMMTYEDPIPGWLNNLYGINGVFTGVGRGVLRIFYIDNRKRADIIPADIVVNSSLAVIWHNVTQGGIKKRQGAQAPVYNCINCVDNPVTWGKVKDSSVPLAKKYPTKNILWIAIYNTTKIYWVYYILRIFYHIIPAFIFDLIAQWQGKPKQVVKIYKKIHRFSGAIAYFTNNEWDFENFNMRMVLDAMDRVDQKYFIADMKPLKWDDIFEIFCKGIRQYIGNETLDTIPEGRRYYQKVEVVHYIILLLTYSFLAFCTYSILDFYGFSESGRALVADLRGLMRAN